MRQVAPRLGKVPRGTAPRRAAPCRAAPHRAALRRALGARSAPGWWARAAACFIRILFPVCVPRLAQEHAFAFLPSTAVARGERDGSSPCGARARGSPATPDALWWRLRVGPRRHAAGTLFCALILRPRHHKNGGKLGGGELVASATTTLE